MNNRDLTEEEIKALSLELKVCYMLTGWNSSFQPKSIKQWAETLGWIRYNYKELDMKDSIEIAEEEAYERLEFIQKFII